MFTLDRITGALSAALGALTAPRAAAPTPTPATRADSWGNAFTGVSLGTGRTAFTFTETGRLDDYTLESLFAGDGIAARICKAIPDEALRKGLRFHTQDPKLHTALSGRFDDLGAPDKLHAAWTWARLYGGAAVFVGADDGLAPNLPLDLTAIRSVRFLRVHDKRALQPNTYYRDGLHPLCGEPETYRITEASSQAVVHESRLIRFDGAMTPNQRRRFNQGWCDSEIQRCFDALVAYNGSSAAAATLLQSSSQAVFAVKDLRNTLAQDKGDTFRRRMELMELFRGLHRSILLDAEGERYERTETSILGGVPDTVKVFILLLSAVSEIPVTVLMGQAPAGLNATGESDLRMWAARVVAQQTKQLKPRAARLARLLLLAKDGPTGGVEPDAWDVQFPSLYDLTPTEAATVVKTMSDADKQYKEMGVLTPEEIGESRFRADGWNPDTVRAPRAPAAAVPAPTTASATPAAATADAETAPQNALDADRHALASEIVDRVAARAISRDTGLSQLRAIGLTPEQAALMMGDVGATHFTAPEPSHAAEMQRLRGEHAAALASQRSAKAMLEKVLEANRAGKLATGNLFKLGAPKADAVQHMDAAWHTGLALVLPVPAELATTLAVEGGETAADLHVTLAFLGEASALDAGQLALLRALVAGWAKAHAPLAGVIAGQGRFLAPSGEPDPVYLAPDVPALACAREELIDLLCAAGFEPSAAHGFTPHITVAYTPKGEPGPTAPSAQTPVTFGAVGLWAGDERETFPLTGEPDASDAAA